MSEFDETLNGNRTEGIIYSFLCEKLNYFETTYGIFLKEWFIIIVNFIISVNTDFLNFDDFQLKILKVFLIFLVINIILIVFLWNTYRDRIYERFIQPGKHTYYLLSTSAICKPTFFF